MRIPFSRLIYDVGQSKEPTKNSKRETELKVSYIIHLQQDGGCEEHTISLFRCVPLKLPRNDLKISPVHFCFNFESIELLARQAYNTYIPSVLAMSWMVRETCSLHEHSSVSFTLPWTCNIPPLFLQKVGFQIPFSYT